MALLPDDDTLRATCAGIIERAKIDVRQPSAQRPEPPNIPHRGKNLTQLENSTRGPPHRKLPSRKELYQSDGARFEVRMSGLRPSLAYARESRAYYTLTYNNG